MDPPIPERTKKLERHYEEGEIIEFGGNVTYTCTPGHFFEENYYMPHFNLTCLPDGNFTDLDSKKRCLNPKSKY